MRDRLKRADRPTELLPVLGVLKRQIKGRLRTAAVASGGRDSLELKSRQNTSPTIVLTANELTRRNADVVERQFIGTDATAAQHVKLAQFQTRRVVWNEKK